MRAKVVLEELRDLAAEELKERERELSQKLFTLRLAQTTGQLENPANVRQARRDLARVLTVMQEKRQSA